MEKEKWKNNTTIWNKNIKKMNKATMISSELLRDDRISLLAKGIMIEILSNNESYVIHKFIEKNKSKLSTYKFEKAWKELEEFGYIEMKRNWGSWTIIITHEPIRTLSI